MGFIDRVRTANQHDLSQFCGFFVAGQRVGFIGRRACDLLLSQWPEVFAMNKFATDKQAITLQGHLNDPACPAATRTEVFAGITGALREQKILGPYWWNERYAVNRSFHQPACFLIERAAVQFFGVAGYGVHLNGFVGAGKKLKMWIAKRALNKPSAPGKLDQMVAGGQPAGMSLEANLVKECAEEAAIPARLAQRAVPCGAVSYCLQTAQGLRPDVLYVFDLELPADFTPDNADNEVEEFYLWPIEKVIATVRDTEAFKFNCALVIIDFLLRHGFIAPADADYLPLLAGLRYREIVLAGVDGQQSLMS